MQEDDGCSAGMYFVCRPLHREGLARAGLAVREQTAVVALQTAFGDGLPNTLKNCFLRMHGTRNS